MSLDDSDVADTSLLIVEPDSTISHVSNGRIHINRYDFINVHAQTLSKIVKAFIK